MHLQCQETPEDEANQAVEKTVKTNKHLQLKTSASIKQQTNSAVDILCPARISVSRFTKVAALMILRAPAAKRLDTSFSELQWAVNSFSLRKWKKNLFKMPPYRCHCLEISRWKLFLSLDVVFVFCCRGKDFINASICHFSFCSL